MSRDLERLEALDLWPTPYDGEAEHLYPGPPGTLARREGEHEREDNDMGLDCSHGAFNGAYSSFNRFRMALAAAAGGSWPPHAPGASYNGRPLGAGEWCWDEQAVPPEFHAGLVAIMEHSDCDGSLSPNECAEVARFLRWAAGRMAGRTTGHLALTGTTMADVAIRFAEGCERAAAANEDLIFG